MEMILLDTAFLVDFEREIRKRVQGRAAEFLTAHPEDPLFITPTIAGEFASGASMAERDVWQEAIEPFTILPITSRVAWVYGEIYRDLRGKGKLIGANDMWIAAAAIEHHALLVTSNEKDFSRVANLRFTVY